MTDVKERVIHGTRAILRPVLMASFLAAFGFLPMALATSQGAEVQRPISYSSYWRHFLCNRFNIGCFTGALYFIFR